MLNSTKKMPSKARRATVIASIVALVLVSIKLAVGMVAGSVSLIASAVDSGLDFLVSLLNYFAIRSSEKPSDEFYNYGRGKIEALASMAEGLIIAVSSAFIIISAIYKFTEDPTVQRTDAAIMVMAISAIITFLLVRYLRSVAQDTRSLVVETDALHYQVDMLTNVGILVGLVVIHFTDWHWIDPAISVVIAILILREVYGLFKKAFHMLLDRALEPELIQNIETVLKTTSTQVTSYHALKTRSAADKNFVDIHVVFHRDISLLQAHRITDQIEHRIRGLNDQKWHIQIHMDPFDDSKRDAKAVAES